MPRHTPKPDVVTVTDWDVVRALWTASNCMSDFRALIAFNSDKVGNIRNALKWGEDQMHPGESGITWIGKWKDKAEKRDKARQLRYSRSFPGPRNIHHDQ